ncbi:MAG: ribonuclease III [Candidatus Azobacteroides sp.]|nr:ribonuclease III [Candidatus Azobacteroides sp.]
MLNLIFNRIRFFRNKKKGSYFVFYNILGFFPKNIFFYEEALRHKSSTRETESEKHHNNERLEFLGDAILDAIVADIVFQKFKTKNEGFLTNTRAKIVQRETLNHIATELGLNKVIISSSRINAQKSHILGNALEALIGAIYLDQGYNKTYKFIEKHIIERYLNIEKLAKKEVNFKSKLLEWCQKYRIELEFELIESFKDEDYNPIFQTQVKLNGLLAGVGIGNSKKAAHQGASEMALKKIRTENEFSELVKSKRKKTEFKTFLPAIIYSELIFDYSAENS